MKLGFTGSRRPLIHPQVVALTEFLVHPIIPQGVKPGIWEAHHGDCTGGDEYFHDTIGVVNPECIRHVHSPRENQHRAFVTVRSTDILWPPKDYLIRNRDIIESCDLLIGCPSSMTFSLGSGSWWTIEAAKKVNKPTIIILPNGSKEYFNVAIPPAPRK